MRAVIQRGPVLAVGQDGPEESQTGRGSELKSASLRPGKSANEFAPRLRPASLRDAFLNGLSNPPRDDCAEHRPLSFRGRPARPQVGMGPKNLRPDGDRS